ncbi:MAG: hypothetical protein Q4D61_01720 [Cardiobacteriaceae bacterium]|nr:hypothetical protein [Cardiobacteriaceae bacterium]
METFFYTAFTFPTAVPTFLLMLAVLFWLVSLLGLIDADSLLDGLDGGDGNFAESGGLPAALLWRFRLIGYPITLTLTVVALFAWWLCYYAMFFLTPLLPWPWLRYPVGIALLPLAFYAAAWLAGKALLPLRPLFVQKETRAQGFVGKTAVVRTSAVDEHFGEATLDDGGAGLIVQVRSRTPLDAGTRVVLLEFDAQDHVYYVMAEQEFFAKE